MSSTPVPSRFALWPRLAAPLPSYSPTAPQVGTIILASFALLVIILAVVSWSRRR